MKPETVSKVILLFILVLFSSGISAAQNQWQKVDTENEAHKRHENAFVKSGDKFYLIGGRGIKPVDIYDPNTQSWTHGAALPLDVSHFQAVNYHGLIYVLGGLVGRWPSETPLSHIWIYDPLTDRWFIGPEIPPHRQRGAAGVVVYDNKIYLVCGIVNGHTSGWVPWLDEFNPATNIWRELPDAPRSRDHFQAAVAGDKLVAAGGRKSGYDGQGFQATIAETDVYDFRSGSWSTLPSPEGDIPTMRAGTAAIAVDGEVIVIGGESGSQSIAHDEVEALNPETGIWRTLPALQTGRHGTQPVFSDGYLYVEAGSGNRGGGPELSSLERYSVPGVAISENEPITAGAPVLSAEHHHFGNVRPRDSRTRSFEIKNSDGNQGILITYMIVTGSDEFKAEYPYSLPHMIVPGDKATFDVHYSPKSAQSATASLLIKIADRGNRQPLEIMLEGN